VGDLTVSLTVTSAIGSVTETKTEYLTVSAPPSGPTAAFSADPTSGAAPLTVQFTDESAPGDADITAWQWEFGDGADSADRQPVHVYTEPGAYTVTLKVTTELGTGSRAKGRYIHVLGAPEGEGEGEGEIPSCVGGAIGTPPSVGKPRADVTLLVSAVAALILARKRTTRAKFG